MDHAAYKELLDFALAEQRDGVMLRDENRRLRAALRQILENPDAKILDSHRDDGWIALGTVKGTG